ncbi:hypothetical protein F2Q69_00018936 [Brassica cretica]|uniref:Cyclin C-terminal domain-containing protein n=1 Tax=Brassica cretica TaxID=69181 RepID=A0A8S9QAT9_BRACR|nr:hypothetical protein F2Q69_00018936 [Brassica cretica]
MSRPLWVYVRSEFKRQGLYSSRDISLYALASSWPKDSLYIHQDEKCGSVLKDLATFLLEDVILEDIDKLRIAPGAERSISFDEVCAPQVEEFCYITDNTYLKDEVLDMESAVLNYLKFEMSAPTVKCFLRRFSRAAQGVHGAPCMQLECMASYIAELSLLEYTMLSHPPSLVAASAIFLAKYTLDPTRRPWNSTLRHYTQYEAMELRGCVMDLQRLCSNAHVSTLPAVRDKYSQHKYKFVAKKFCPSIIPPDFFKNS